MKLTNNDKPVKIVPNDIHLGMYRLEWEDGVKSEDMYNWTRANDILKNYELYRSSMERSERMFGLEGGTH